MRARPCAVKVNSRRNARRGGWHLSHLSVALRRAAAAPAVWSLSARLSQISAVGCSAGVAASGFLSAMSGAVHTAAMACLRGEPLCRRDKYRDDMVDPDGNRSTARNDDRITRIGRILRRGSLDELPQLWNVIRGDMSLVGPRPHALGSVAAGALFWEAVPDYWARHAMRPGITGLAQIRGLRGATLARSDIEKRVAADLEYINGWSIWLDLKILLQTIRVVFHRNAF